MNDNQIAKAVTLKFTALSIKQRQEAGKNQSYSILFCKVVRYLTF